MSTVLERLKKREANLRDRVKAASPAPKVTAKKAAPKEAPVEAPKPE